MLERVGANTWQHKRTNDGLEMTTRLQYTQCWRELVLPRGSMREQKMVWKYSRKMGEFAGNIVRRHCGCGQCVGLLGAASVFRAI